MPKLFQQCVTAYFIVVSGFTITLISYKPFIKMNCFNPCFTKYCSAFIIDYNYVYFFLYFFVHSTPVSGSRAMISH